MGRGGGRGRYCTAMRLRAIRAGRGHPSAEIALLVSKDRGRTFNVFEVSGADATAANWLPNLERPTGSEPIEVPSLIYTHGPRGKTNKDIMTNEVIWCDIATLLAGDQM